MLTLSFVCAIFKIVIITIIDDEQEKGKHNGSIPLQILWFYL